MNKVSFIAAFGSNVPLGTDAPLQIIQKALDHFSDDIQIIKRSRYYETRAYPVSDRGNFINSAVLGNTSLTAAALLAHFHETEARFSRVREERWAARTLDIDLIAYNNDVMPKENEWRALANHEDEAYYIEAPMVPHPRAHKRDFVLRPITDIAPDWLHPVFKRSARELLAELSTSDAGGSQAVLKIVE